MSVARVSVVAHTNLGRGSTMSGKLDSKEREAAIRAPRGGDDSPAALTAFQALKLADIVTEAVYGRDVSPEDLRAVSVFLRAAAMEGMGVLLPTVMGPTTAELWPQLDARPWAPPLTAGELRDRWGARS
jgi:hypothetical protein